MKLRIRQSVPPNPETIFAEFSSFRLGNKVPRHNAIEFSEIVTIKITMLSVMVWIVVIFNSELDMKIKRVVKSPVMRQELINFWRIIFFMLIGDIANIQSLRPSKLNWGKTNLVVRVDKDNEQTPRFIKAMSDDQNSLLYWYPIFLMLRTYKNKRP